MRFFDVEKVGCYLDAITHRVEKTADGRELKIVDLVLRVQPFTPELAAALDADVCTLLFQRNEPRSKVKRLEVRLPMSRQLLTVYLLPDEPTALAQIAFTDVEISRTRARAEKGVDGYGFVFTASFGPPSPQDLEFVCGWHGNQKFLTFEPQEKELDFDAPTTIAHRKPRAAAPAH